jgi:hypothetical protein
MVSDDEAQAVIGALTARAQRPQLTREKRAGGGGGGFARSGGG